MSLFSSIQLASNALNAAQIGLQVTGNNIANASTPGYIREEVVLNPAPTQRVGSLLLGLGVDVTAIIQQVDRFLEERLRGANSDLLNGETQENTYLQLEALVGELSETDLSTSLNNFFNGINDILNQPESISVRNLAVLRGETLATDIRRLDARVRDIRRDVNNRVTNAADDINRLTSDIAELNVQIVTLEGGGTSASDAVGLRDRRLKALEELSGILNIRGVEQPNGSVTVFVGGEYLVFEGTNRPVTAAFVPDRGLNVAEIRLEATDAPLNNASGELAGLITSRDEILGGFLDKLDDFARTLAFEFNKIYSSGQGLTGYEDLTSTSTVDDTQAALDQAGLSYTPTNGSFQVQVFNKQTGLTKTSDILVQLNGLDDDTSLEDLAAALEAIDGISAAITPSRELTVTSDSPNVQFAFAADTSGVLAALGLGVFFTGTGAGDVNIDEVVRNDPSKFTASQSGVGADTENAILLAGFLDRPLDSQGGATLADTYDRLVGETTQGAAVARAVADGFRTFQRTLEGQKLAISGVSLDEEAINMITFQRMFQATARYISTVSDLLDLLVNL